MASLSREGPAKALVLAAGLGSRIRTIAGDLPKPLIPFGGRSILAHNLRWLQSSGVEEVWINTHFGAAAIREAIGDGSAFGLSVNYTFEPDLLGTAGALANIASVADQTMLVVYGDNIVRCDLGALARAHRAGAALATLCLFDQSRHAHTGIAGGRVVVDGQGLVTGFVEGGEAGLVNAGVYLVEPQLIDRIPPGRSFDFARDVFPEMLASGAPLRGHVLEPAGFCLGLDTPESFRAGEALLATGRVTLS